MVFHLYFTSGLGLGTQLWVRIGLADNVGVNVS